MNQRLYCNECGTPLAVETGGIEWTMVKPCEVCVNQALQAGREESVLNVTLPVRPLDCRLAYIDGSLHVLRRILEMCRDREPRKTRESLVSWAEDMVDMLGRG